MTKMMQIDRTDLAANASLRVGPLKVTDRHAHVSGSHVSGTGRLVRFVERTGAPDTFESCLALPAEEGSDSSIAGATLLEAAMQMTRATCHLFHDVPLAHRFVVQDMGVASLSWARPGLPVTARATLDVDARRAAHEVWSCKATVEFCQDGVRIAEARCTLRALPAEMERAMMTRARTALAA